jgi:hypothetical protein
MATLAKSNAGLYHYVSSTHRVENLSITSGTHGHDTCALSNMFSSRLDLLSSSVPLLQCTTGRSGAD